MNQQQEAFLQEYLRTGDKLKAYQLAYPKAKQSSLKNAANRLLQNNPEIIAAVAGKRAELYEEAVTEAKAQIKADIVTELEAKQVLSQTIRGQHAMEKVWYTRNGFETHDVKPTHAQVLGAIRQLALMEGWYKKQKAEKKEEEKPEEPYSLQIFMNKLPWDEYRRINRNTLEAYYDPDGPTWRTQPDNNHMAHKFLPLQKKREERRDEERQERMTPQLKLEEEQALREFENRSADEDGYVHHEKLIDDLLNEYSEAPEPAKLEALTAIQNMCGLRFLHHRHRYEAERKAGWQFHPFNHALIKPVNPDLGRHFEHRETSPEPKHQAQAQPQNRQQPTTNHQGRHSDPEPMQVAKSTETTQPEPPKPKPTHLDLLKQGYTPINELWQDEFDYYIKHQCSTTWKQKKDMDRFSAHRKAPPETRKQIEEETGWLYHPDDTNYGKRHPKRPLVRTRFKGPQGS